MAALPVSSLRLAFWTLLFVSGLAQGQQREAERAPPPPACPVQPAYPLPGDPAQLHALADKLDSLAGDAGCLKTASFHAWRGAVLVSLGRAGDAVEALERALLLDPDLPGAMLDLAQAFAMQGDQKSATSLLGQLRDRPDLPEPVRDAIDERAAIIARAAATAHGAEAPTWQSRWQLAAMAGTDTNLNNAPSSTEVTLTLPQGNQVVTLDPAAGPRKGSALLTTVQWQGLKARGDSVLVLQGEVRARSTREGETSYQQGDFSASWLSAPAAPRQWVARASASYLRFGGANLLQAYRASLQHQWEAYSLPWISRVLRTAGSCRPSVGAELEYRHYPTTSVLDGVYQGAAGGLICRADADYAAPGAVSQPASLFNLQLRLGSERPSASERAGGTYQRGEIRAQWEGSVAAKGKLGVQWSSTLQRDSDPYSPLLGNVPRKIFRNGVQLEASWQVGSGFALIGTAEFGRQRSNIAVFENRQRSFFIGVRREVM